MYQMCILITVNTHEYTAIYIVDGSKMELNNSCLKMTNEFHTKSLNRHESNTLIKLIKDSEGIVKQVKLTNFLFVLYRLGNLSEPKKTKDLHL
ncbi:hypothetical protein CWI38_1747p0020 [Hamiltosporidium tvaerminnensis]|uniref:Uncharacterized protein n=1 Tax=Hamiltosporidium tvaerminnensis TaxID=1176355 RepID=A0A4Q9LQH3_9MICR|nr:hypothetical protein CWI38_1747p0020 [Hamiltosporidium tvaerminnensis]